MELACRGGRVAGRYGKACRRRRPLAPPRIRDASHAVPETAEQPIGDGCVSTACAAQQAAAADRAPLGGTALKRLGLGGCRRYSSWRVKARGRLSGSTLGGRKTTHVAPRE